MKVHPTTQHLDVTNPATGELITTVPDGGPEAIDAAVAAAFLLLYGRTTAGTCVRATAAAFASFNRAIVC